MIDENKLIKDIHNYFKYRIDKSGLEVIDNDVLTLNKEICEIVKNQPKVDNWISCFDGLPVDGENVIACFCTGTVTELLYEGEGKFRGLYEYPKDVIIAWQPLPAPYNADMRGGKNG